MTPAALKKEWRVFFIRDFWVQMLVVWVDFLLLPKLWSFQ